MNIRGFSLVVLPFVFVLALAVGLTREQEAAGGGKEMDGPLSAEAVVSTAFTYQGTL